MDTQEVVGTQIITIDPVQQDKIEAEQREAHRKLNEEAARVRAEQDAEAKRQREERARLDAERAAIVDARDKAEAAAREATRKEAERQDGYGMLTMFCARFGKLEEFAGIVLAIETFLEGKGKA